MPTEKYTSRSERLTMNGYQFTTRYTATRDETLDLAANGLPVIGDYWSAARDDIRCTDIFIDQLAGNIYVKIVAIWSTEGDEYRNRRANQIASWEEHLDVSTETKLIDGAAWYKTAWAALEDGREAEDAPQLVIDKRSAIYRLTVFGTDAYLNRLIQASGKVNSVQFLTEIHAKIKSVKSSYSVDAHGEGDTGKWMYMGVEFDHIGSGTYKYDLFFQYRSEGWTTQNGVEDVVEVPTMDLVTLVDGMDLIEDDENMGFFDD